MGHEIEEDPFLKDRETMVRGQIEARGVSDGRILEAMRRVPRHRFVPRELWRQAHADHPLPIGPGQTISQPYIVASMAEALHLQAGDRVLEVGSGSGYAAAVLSRLCARVFGIELEPGTPCPQRRPGSDPGLPQHPAPLRRWLPWLARGSPIQFPR